MVFKRREFSEKRNRSNAFAKNGWTQAFPKKNKTYGAPDAQDEKTAAELCIKERLTESPRKRTSEKCSTQISGAERAFHFPCAQLYLGIFDRFRTKSAGRAGF